MADEDYTFALAQEVGYPVLAEPEAERECASPFSFNDGEFTVREGMIRLSIITVTACWSSGLSRTLTPGHSEIQV